MRMPKHPYFAIRKEPASKISYVFALLVEVSPSLFQFLSYLTSRKTSRSSLSARLSPRCTYCQRFSFHFAISSKYNPQLTNDITANLMNIDDESLKLIQKLTENSVGITVNFLDRTS